MTSDFFKRNPPTHSVMSMKSYVAYISEFVLFLVKCGGFWAKPGRFYVRNNIQVNLTQKAIKYCFN